MQVVELTVTLLDMPYPVTRRLRVPMAITLAGLHKVLQAAMPWDDSHLFDFSLGRTQRWAKPSPDDWGDTRSATKERLADVLAELGRKRAFTYTYDMGDSWEHEIKPGKPALLEPGADAVALLAAEGACPPEDSGGAPGFDYMLDAAADPTHESHAEILDWLGDAFPWNPAVDAVALADRVRKVGARTAKRL